MSQKVMIIKLMVDDSDSDSDDYIFSEEEKSSGSEGKELLQGENLEVPIEDDQLRNDHVYYGKKFFEWASAERPRH